MYFILKLYLFIQFKIKNCQEIKLFKKKNYSNTLFT